MIGTFLPLVLCGGIKSATGGVIMAGLVVVGIGLIFSAVSMRIRDNNGQGEPGISFCKKIFVCVLAGIFCSMLQFAVIFGQDLVYIVENDVATPLGGSASIIWLFAISIGAIRSIIYGIFWSYKPEPMGVWGRVIDAIHITFTCGWWRHLCIFCTTSLPWVTQIQLYGLAANVLLPKDFAASIAWPTLMTTTVAQGMALSFWCLGEWTTANDEAKCKQVTGLCLTLIGVVLFMVSVAVSRCLLS